MNTKFEFKPREITCGIDQGHFIVEGPGIFKHMAIFTDKEDAELFCLIPELIQLLRKRFIERIWPSEENRLAEILEEFNPDFFKTELPEPSPDVPEVHDQSESLDWLLCDPAQRRRLFHKQDDLPCEDEQ
jgi:hypothetical protein